MRYTITLAAASAAAAIAATAASVSAEVPEVVTDMPVVHSLVTQVMGDLGTPAVLLDQGADSHSFQLRPSQAAALSGADLLFWVGPEMTPWLDRAITGVGLRGEAISLLHAEGVTTRAYDDADPHDHGDGHGHDHGDGHGHDHAHGHDHDHGHDHGHDEAHGHEDHDHAHDGLDPHAWLDPENARVWLDVIAVELAEHDPENASVYQANAEAARAAIQEAEAQVAALLEPVGDTPIYVFHDAYGYFADHFGLNISGTVASGDAASPGAARLSALRDEAGQGAAVCIFPEAQHDPRQVELLAEGNDMRVGAPLDPEGSTLTYGPDLYTTLLLGLAQNIADCVTES